MVTVGVATVLLITFIGSFILLSYNHNKFYYDTVRGYTKLQFIFRKIGLFSF